MRFESSVDIDASPEKIWIMLSNLEEWPRWAPKIKRVEIVSPGPLGVNSQLRIKVKAGVAVKLRMTITEFVPNERVVMRGRILGTRLTRHYILEPRADKTIVAVGGEASGCLAWLVGRSGRALSDDIAMALKKRIEGTGSVG